MQERYLLHSAPRALLVGAMVGLLLLAGCRKAVVEVADDGQDQREQAAQQLSQQSEETDDLARALSAEQDQAAILEAHQRSANAVKAVANLPPGLAAVDYPAPQQAVQEISNRLQVALHRNQPEVMLQLFRADTQRHQALSGLHEFIDASQELRETIIKNYGQAGWTRFQEKYGGMLYLPDFAQAQIEYSSDDEYTINVPGMHGLPLVVRLEEERWAVDSYLIFQNSQNLVHVNNSYGDASALLRRAIAAAASSKPLPAIDRLLENELERTLRVQGSGY